MPKQIFEIYDYLGPLVAALIFAVCLLVLAFFFLNFFLVAKGDEPTIFEKVCDIYEDLNLSFKFLGRQKTQSSTRATQTQIISDN